MRRSLSVAFALVLAAGSTEARADELVTYVMTGRIWASGEPWQTSWASGDHITWKLQYPPTIQPQAPLGGQFGTSQYQTSSAAITSIVDQRTGYHFPLLSASPSSILVKNWWHAPGDPHLDWNTIRATSDTSQGSASYYSSLLLQSKNLLPTMNLTELQLNHTPLVLSSNLYYRFEWSPTQIISFTASVDSVTRVNPEPGTLTLCLLGAAGLAAGGLRRRWRLVG